MSPAFLTCILFGLILGCGGSKTIKVPSPIPDDRRHIPPPKSREISIIADGINNQFTLQIEQSLEFSRQFRNLSGNQKEALNIDAFGEVSNSSWFTNRNATYPMTVEEVAQGPNSGEGPDTSGVWKIFRAKTEGVTPGFHIKDKRGVRYVIKFDPVGYSELTSGAEVVSTKLFYAAGYHVPENYIVYFHPRILKLGEKVKFVDSQGRKRNMNQGDLKEILDMIEHQPDGKIRAMASKYIMGKPIGPFRYIGTRKDDPNDIVPHQHRRELRGLRVIAAWLSHYDTKANNSFDSYVMEGGKSYVRHYLIDFGSTLGSIADGPKRPQIGHENAVDLHEILKNLLTLGLYVRSWEKMEDVRYPSVGRFESKSYHPKKYKFIRPNPAFENLTNQDGYWGAKVVMSFTDEQLRAAIDEGMYSDSEAAQYLLQTLIERRDKTGRYWFERVCPLDRFQLQENSGGKQFLCFQDLTVDGGLETIGVTQYQYSIYFNENVVVEWRNIGKETCIPLPEKEFVLRGKNPNSDSHPHGDLWEVLIQVERRNPNQWKKWVRVQLDREKTSGEYSLLGVRRQD